jgi:hypothetical protein
VSILVAVILLTLLALLTMSAIVGANALRLMAEDRAREARYADEWVRRRRLNDERLAEQWQQRHKRDHS